MTRSGSGVPSLAIVASPASWRVPLEPMPVASRTLVAPPPAPADPVAGNQG